MHVRALGGRRWKTEREREEKGRGETIWYVYCKYTDAPTSPSLIYWPLHTHAVMCLLEGRFLIGGDKNSLQTLLLKDTPFAKIEGSYLSTATDREKECMYVCGGGKRERGGE